jgi:hypothetical protein
MSYKIEVSPVSADLTLRDLPDGALAIVLDGEFKGELFYKNVAGLHSISGNRYWPSAYAERSQGGLNHYQGPLDARCRQVVAGDVLAVLGNA